MDTSDNEITVFKEKKWYEGKNSIEFLMWISSISFQEAVSCNFTQHAFIDGYRSFGILQQGPTLSKINYLSL